MAESEGIQRIVSKTAVQTATAVMMVLTKVVQGQDQAKIQPAKRGCTGKVMAN